MNKQDAAKYLGIGFRSLERYTSEGRVVAGRVRGRTGTQLDYEESELARFKAELEAPPQVIEAPPERPAAVPPKPAKVPPEDSKALARVEPQVLAGARQQGTEGAQVLVPLEVLAGLAARLDLAEKPRAVLGEKIMLDLADAVSLSGLSRGHLRAAIDSGELQAKRIGRGWKMLRSDLLKYLEGLLQ
jgi:excisionase family DNA binding protein